MLQTCFKKNTQKENQAQNSNNTWGKAVTQKEGRIWEYDKEEKLWEDRYRWNGLVASQLVEKVEMSEVKEMEDEYNDNYKTLHVAQIVNTEQLQHYIP